MLNEEKGTCKCSHPGRTSLALPSRRTCPHTHFVPALHHGSGTLQTTGREKEQTLFSFVICIHLLFHNTEISNYIIYSNLLSTPTFSTWGWRKLKGSEIAIRSFVSGIAKSITPLTPTFLMLQWLPAFHDLSFPSQSGLFFSCVSILEDTILSLTTFYHPQNNMAGYWWVLWIANRCTSLRFNPESPKINTPLPSGSLFCQEIIMPGWNNPRLCWLVMFKTVWVHMWKGKPWGQEERRQLPCSSAVIFFLCTVYCDKPKNAARHENAI